MTSVQEHHRSVARDFADTTAWRYPSGGPRAARADVNKRRDNTGYVHRQIITSWVGNRVPFSGIRGLQT